MRCALEILNQDYPLKSANPRSQARWGIDQSQAQLYPLGGLVVQVNGKPRWMVSRCAR